MLCDEYVPARELAEAVPVFSTVPPMTATINADTAAILRIMNAILLVMVETSVEERSDITQWKPGSCPKVCIDCPIGLR
ncbi:hypothetical protein ACWEFL_33000 [Streptomyces sp. NPDC004838]